MKIKIKFVGTIKWYNQEKGFGFIKYDESEKRQDIFFHVRDLLFRHEEEALLPGKEVIFEVETDKRTDGKTRAISVETLKGAYEKYSARNSK